MVGIRVDRTSLSRFGAVSLMTALAVVLVGGVFSTRARAAPTVTFHRTVGTAASKTDGTTLQVTVPGGGVAAGHSVVVTLAMDDATGSLAVSDSRGNAYNVDAEIAASGGSAYRTAIISAHNITALAAGDVITITTPLVRARAAGVADFSGLATSNALDQRQGVSGSGATPTTGAVSTTQAGELLIGAIGVEGPVEDIFTAGDTGAPSSLPFSALGRAGTTGNSAASNVTIDPEYRIVSATGSYAARGGLSPGRSWAALIATYRVDVTPPTPTVDPAPSSAGNYVNSRTPSFAGSAGSLNSDASSVTLKIFKDGSEIRSLDVTPAGAAWGPVIVSPALPADGNFTAVVQQSDQATNVGSSSTSFTVDTAKPTSSINPLPAVHRGDIAITYTVDDPSGSGAKEVELWAKGPDDDAFVRVQVDTSPASPTFTFAGGDDGDYAFYTRAGDNASNLEDAPAEADAVTMLDAALPSSSVDPLPARSIATRTIAYAASDATSGIDRVQLWVKEPDGSFELHGTDLDPTTPRFDFAATVDGAHEFYTVAVDRAGNEELPPPTGTPDASSTFDIQEPSSSVDALPGMSSEDLTLTYAASDAGPSGVASVELWVKGPNDDTFSLLATDADPATPRFDHTATEDGTFAFYTRARDAAGNYEAAAAEPDAATTVEIHDPVSALDAAPIYQPSRSLELTYAASDIGSGLGSVELWARRPGDGAFSLVDTDPTPNDTRSFTYGAASDGTYSFYTRARDDVGHYESAPEDPDATVIVDGAAPSSIATAPANSAGSIEVGYSTADATSGVDEVRLYVKGPNDDAFDLAATDPTPDQTQTFTYDVSQGVGRYDFYTRAVDRAGNVEDPPDQSDSSTMMDDARPASSASSPPAADGAFTVAYAASDTGAGLDRIDLYVKGPNDVGFEAAGSVVGAVPTGTFDYDPVQGDGDYAFYTIARDAAGNIEPEPATGDATTTVDTVDPVTTDDADPAWHSEDFTVTLSATDGSSGVARTEYRIDGTAGDPPATGTAVAINVDTIGDGTHTISYRSIDAAGNVEPLRTATVKVDTRDPQTTDDADDGWHRRDFDVTLSATDPGTDDVPATGAGVATTEYRIDDGTFATGTIVAINVDTIGDGTHTISYRSIDAAGNRAPLQAATVKLDAGAPTTTDDYDGAWHNDDVTVTLAATDPYSGVTDTFHSTDGATTYAPGDVVTIAAAGADGIHDVHYYSSDAAGNLETPRSVTVKIDTARPTSAASAPATAGSGSIAIDYVGVDDRSGLSVIELYVKAPGDDTYELAATDDASGATGSFAYDPDAGPGTYRFYTIATDAAGNREDAPAQPDATTDTTERAAPESSASAPAVTRLGTFRVTYAATDPGADASGVTSVELYLKAPGELVYSRYGDADTDVSTAHFDVVAPAGADGTYRFYTVATDAAGNVETAFDPAAPDATTTIDRLAPRIDRLRARPNPYYLKRSARTKIGFTVSEASAVKVIVKKGGRIVRRLKSATLTGPANVVRYWNGKNSVRKRVAPGRYVVLITATDAAGNSQPASVYLVVVA